MLELKNIRSGYGKKQVLCELSATFEKGKITSIIGPNGCGKSTLLKTVTGILPLTGGEISVDGTSPASMPRKKLAQKISYLSQGKAVPDMTVKQMVLHGRFAHLSYPRRYRRQDREAALAAMKRMHIEHLAEKPVSSLSGGMRQSAYIAMALCQDTDYILMDEPTTYLDVSARITLMDILRDLADSGKGIIAVLHDLTLAMKYSDEVVVMQNGRTVMSAPPEKIYTSGVTNEVFGVRLERADASSGFAYYYDKTPKSKT